MSTLLHAKQQRSIHRQWALTRPSTKKTTEAYAATPGCPPKSHPPKPNSTTPSQPQPPKVKLKTKPKPDFIPALQFDHIYHLLTFSPTKDRSIPCSICNKHLVPPGWATSVLKHHPVFKSTGCGDKNHYFHESCLLSLKPTWATTAPCAVCRVLGIRCAASPYLKLLLSRVEKHELLRREMGKGGKVVGIDTLRAVQKVYQEKRAERVVAKWSPDDRTGVATSAPLVGRFRGAYRGNTRFRPSPLGEGDGDGDRAAHFQVPWRDPKVDCFPMRYIEDKLGRVMFE